jgi:hypothetical protein
MECQEFEPAVSFETLDRGYRPRHAWCYCCIADLSYPRDHSEFGGTQPVNEGVGRITRVLPHREIALLMLTLSFREIERFVMR